MIGGAGINNVAKVSLATVLLRQASQYSITPMQTDIVIISLNPNCFYIIYVSILWLNLSDSVGYHYQVLASLGKGSF